MVVERDRKHYADVKCEKQRFSRTLPMIFDRLSRHLGLLMLARACAIIYTTVSNLGLLYLWFKLEQKIGTESPCAGSILFRSCPIPLLIFLEWKSAFKLISRMSALETS